MAGCVSCGHGLPGRWVAQATRIACTNAREGEGGKFDAGSNQDKAFSECGRSMADA
jgi:hypothetical protein